MVKKPRNQRKRDIKRGCIGPWPKWSLEPETIAARVRYVGSGKHKTYSSPDDSWVPNHRPGVGGRCDEYAQQEWAKLEDGLRAAILAGCVQFKAGETFPGRVWAYVNGILHEARLTNSERGEYHAFPLEEKSHEPDDPGELLRGAPRVKITKV
jgi:hypothetical protein